MSSQGGAGGRAGAYGAGACEAASLLGPVLVRTWASLQAHSRSRLGQRMLASRGRPPRASIAPAALGPQWSTPTCCGRAGPAAAARGAALWSLRHPRRRPQPSPRSTTPSSTAGRRALRPSFVHCALRHVRCALWVLCALCLGLGGAFCGRCCNCDWVGRCMGGVGELGHGRQEWGGWNSSRRQPPSSSGLWSSPR